MNNRWFSLAALIAFLGLAFAGDGSDRKALKAIEGKWLIESYTLNGNSFPKELLKKARVIFRGNTMTEKPQLLFQDGKFRLGKVEGFTALVQLNESKQPKWFDVIIETDKKSAAYGIYELKDNKLKICYRGTVRLDDAEPRPTQFTSTAGSGNYLLVLQREGN